MSVQTFGMEAFRRAVERGIRLADRAGAYIEASDCLELMSPPSLGVVCFRARPRGAARDEQALERFNEAVQSRVIGEGTAMMSSTRLKGAYALRFCIMAHTTTWNDVERTLQALERYARGTDPT
jgi:glutamate/tyrosine decarboxylase-like PLP-dependent enzyme